MAHFTSHSEMKPLKALLQLVDLLRCTHVGEPNLHPDFAAPIQNFGKRLVHDGQLLKEDNTQPTINIINETSESYS